LKTAGSRSDGWTCRCGVVVRRAAALWLGVILAVVPVCEVGASWNLSCDVDARYRIANGRSPDANLNLFGASLRRTFADARGDRLVFFALFEAEDDFNEDSMHEIYLQYKGPMGAWNVTAGRFGLPWGLLPGFSARRLLYDTAHDRLLGMDVDSGVMLSGVRGVLDYGLSLTRGYGPENSVDAGSHGIVIGRIGLTPGDTEEYVVGLSVAWGRSVTAHGPEHSVERTVRRGGRGTAAHLVGGHAPGGMSDPDRALHRTLAGLDGTLYLGRWLLRSELAAGRVDERSISACFIAADYALRPALDLNLAVNLVQHGSDTMNEWFAGLSGRLPWCILRGGYRYVEYGRSRHQFTLQVYRLFSFTR
jgi:hypothetical protein